MKVDACGRPLFTNLVTYTKVLKSNKYTRITIASHPFYNQGLLYININFCLLYLPDCSISIFQASIKCARQGKKTTVELHWNYTLIQYYI